MPLYDYGCTKCDNIQELSHRMNEIVSLFCTLCRSPMKKLLTFGSGENIKRPDAPWLRSLNGFLNDGEFVTKGKQKEITTREQARAAINRIYSDTNPKVQALRKRYLERI